MSLEIRESRKADLEYILNSWLLTYKTSPAMNHPGLVHEDYYRLTHLQLDELIARSSAKDAAYTLVDHDQPPGRDIAGYLIGEPYPDVKFVHWVQLKQPYWGKKLGSALMDRFIEDHGVQKSDNILYTFSSRGMAYRPRHDARHGFNTYVQKKYSLVFYPSFPYTSMEPGWETK